MAVQLRSIAVVASSMLVVSSTLSTVGGSLFVGFGATALAASR